MTDQAQPLTLETRTNDRLDWIALRVYGYTSGAVEALLEANRYLANQPPRLPQGLILILPTLLTPTPQRVRLWA